MKVVTSACIVTFTRAPALFGVGFAAKDAQQVSEHALTSTRAWQDAPVSANVIQRLSLPAY